MDETHGRHGQELIEDGGATDVLELVGRGPVEDTANNNRQLV